jgi:hypothetical protein
MAVLTSTGINFSDTTALNSKYDIIAQSSAVLFYEAAAPTGWTKVITHDNKAMRVVNGTGGGSGGSTSFLSAFPSTATRPLTATVSVSGSAGPTTIDVNTMAVHPHGGVNTGPAGDHFHGHNAGGVYPGNRVSSGPGPTRPNGPTAYVSTPANSHTHSFNQGAYGNSGSHTHPWSGAAASNFSSSIDLRVQYVDIIICTLN